MRDVKGYLLYAIFFVITSERPAKKVADSGPENWVCQR